MGISKRTIDAQMDAIFDVLGVNGLLAACKQVGVIMCEELASA